MVVATKSEGHPGCNAKVRPARSAATPLPQRPTAKRSASSCPKTRASSGSFTLIELLVVVAIIAVLAAILLPALQRARAAAHNAVCIGNLKQIATACMIYADDYDGYPPNDVSTQGNTTPWYIELRNAKLLDDWWGPARNVPNGRGGSFWVDADGSGYGDNNSTPPPYNSTAWCPAAKVTVEAAYAGGDPNYFFNTQTHGQARSVGGGTWGGLYKGTTYSMNNWLTTDTPEFQGHYGGAAKPWGRYTFHNIGATGEAEKVMLNFCTPHQEAGAAGPGTWAGRMYPRANQNFGTYELNLRHLNHWNAVHWDGHVAAYRESGWEYISWPSERIYPWWPQRRGDPVEWPKMPDADHSINMITLQ